MRRQDGRVILSVTLYQTEGQQAVWSRRYDQPDQPDGWHLVIQSVVASVDIAMTDAEAARAMREHPDSLDKRDLVMISAAGSWAQVSKEKYVDRIAFAEPALALDPNYVAALGHGFAHRLVLSAFAPGWPDLYGRMSRTIWLPVEDREGAVHEM